METAIIEMLLLVGEKNERAKSAIEALHSQYGRASTNPTLLHFAAKYGNVDVVCYLLEQGFEIDALDKSCRTALMEAVLANQKEVTQLLAIVGADITIRDNELKSAFQLFSSRPENSANTLMSLLVAAKQRCSTTEEAAQLLISAGCELHHAIFLDDPDLIVYMLKDEGLDVDARHPTNGTTALHIAVRLGSLEIVQLLLEKGADPHAMDYMNRNAVRYLYFPEENHTEEKRIILQILLDLSVSLTSCIDGGDFQIGGVLMGGTCDEVGAVLQSGIDFGTKDTNGLTIIHYLAVNRDPEVVKELQLYPHKFVVNVTDKDGITPLYVAVTNGNSSMVECLLKHGASINHGLTLTDTYSMLFYAYIESSDSLKKHFDQCAELLLQHGADPQYVDIEGDQVITIFDLIPKEDCFLRMKSVVACIAMLERCGTSISEVILSKIEEHNLVEYLEDCRDVLDENVAGDVTVLQLLSDPLTKMARYVNPNLIRGFDSLTRGLTEFRIFHPYYYSTIQQRLSKAINYKEAASVVCGIFKHVIDETHLVTREIIANLNNVDLEMLFEYSKLYF